jgi:hypothetical protein
MVLGLGLGGAIFSTALGPTSGAPAPADVAAAADTGLRVAAVIATLGTLLSAIREPRVSVPGIAAAQPEAQSGR